MESFGNEIVGVRITRSYVVKLPFNMVFTDQFKVERGICQKTELRKLERRPGRADRRCLAHMPALWLKKGRLTYLKAHPTYISGEEVDPLKKIGAILP